jgi:hypothetical protein
MNRRSRFFGEFGDLMDAGGGAVVEALCQVVGDRLGSLTKDIVGPLPLARVLGGVAFRVGRSFLLGGFSIDRHGLTFLSSVRIEGGLSFLNFSLLAVKELLQDDGVL